MQVFINTLVHLGFLQNGKYKLQKELEGVGICPFNPEHNNTAVESNGSIFAATIGDFSERDPVIYREPQRTELSDLKQLNGVYYNNFFFNICHFSNIFSTRFC